MNKERKMKKLTIALVIVGAFAGTSLGTTLPAAAREAFSFSFDTGAVAFAYSDGYWDNNRQWHNWRNAREAREYRANYGSRSNTASTNANATTAGAIRTVTASPTVMTATATASPTAAMTHRTTRVATNL